MALLELILLVVTLQQLVFTVSAFALVVFTLRGGVFESTGLLRSTGVFDRDRRGGVGVLVVTNKAQE